MTRRAVDAVLVLLAAISLGQFLVLAWIHLHCAAEIDYIEGVMMDQVVRVAHGQPLYVAPSLAFVPVAYMPGLTWAAALLARIFGPAFWEPRLLSVAGTLASAIVAFAAVRSETGRASLGAAAAGVFLAGYHFAGGGHYDVGRPDALMLGLALLGFAALRWGRGLAGIVLAAALLTGAFLTKQHGIWFALAGAAHLASSDRRRLPAYLAAITLGCAGGYLLIARLQGPWFAFYTWDVPSHWSHVNAGRIQAYLRGGLFGLIAPLFLATLALGALPAGRGWRRLGIWGWAALAGIGTGLLATLDPNAWKHTFIPTMLTFSIAGVIALHLLAEELGAAWAGSATRVAALLGAVLALQFAALASPLRAELPSREATAARDDLLARLRAIPGPVIVLHHGFFSWQAGKGAAVQDIGFGDIDRALGNRLQRRDPGALERVLDPLRSGAGRPTLVVDMRLPEAGPLWAPLDTSYTLAEDWGSRLAGLRPLWGYQGVPRYVYRPRTGPGAAPPAATR